MTHPLSEQQLLAEIECHRMQLLKIGQANGLNNANTLAISEKLDALIIQYQLLSLKGFEITNK